ncbi:hypothetical protein HH310_21620 [Actinoplanes sp. TBRC 11911]|uniref:hypothetical protein n=1 Tax=Actinoplanes sp. TBRC 11911 TaxID=2729386 RepID=UPI00145E6D6A|nr:hypothetical protein [Actinoplanes sp. TBRC 11911]NMO53769.1 hypothetical protein [Actinoplanes sp. TBRC 11911]
MIARRIATLLATLFAVTGLGAGGSPAAAGTRHTEAVTIAPARTSHTRPAAQDAPAAARTGTGVRNVPSAFLLPPGSRVTALSDHEAGASFTLTEPGPQAVLSFYRGELPQRAFTIVADRAEHGATSLAFRSPDGWAGMIYATAYRATVALRRA